MKERSHLEKLQEELKDPRYAWYERIAIHNNGIGTILGFSIAVMGAFTAFIHNKLSLIEAIVLTITCLILFQLGGFWIKQLERDRDIEWHIYWALHESKFGDSNESKKHIKQAQLLRQGNSEEGPLLNELVRLGLGLTLLLLVLHSWIPFVTNNQIINTNHMNYILLILVFLVSGILGYLKAKYTIKLDKLQREKSNDPLRPRELDIIEYWNNFVSYSIAGTILYYFFTYRWGQIGTEKTFNRSDFILFAIFLLGIFGHLNNLSKNITEGINAIFKRVLERQ